jgi:DNA-binding beta-propeller fold protein YncE
VRLIAVACLVGLVLTGVLVWIALAGPPEMPSSRWTTPVADGLVAQDGLGFGDAVHASSFANSPLVPELQSLDEAQLPVQGKVSGTSPKALAARRDSQTRFENLDIGQAIKLAASAFPALIDHPAGGPPTLPTGQKIVGYLSDTVAQVDLGGRRRGVIEATEPMALETSPGHQTPLDLGLTKVGSAFEPVRPLVDVSIPRRLNEGVELPTLSLSVTPVDAKGSPLRGSEGAVDGSGVLYANTETDSDTLIKPTTGGFEADTLLRSVGSPEHLYFRVKLPEGAQLVPSAHGQGAVNVMLEGRPIAVVPPPSARDASGASVPVTMGAAGDVLELAVATHAGAYQWPLAVDPSVTDTHFLGEGVHSSWRFGANTSKAHGGSEVYGLKGEMSGTYSPGESYVFYYQTRGASHIYELQAEVGSNDIHGRGVLLFEHEGLLENSLVVAENSGRARSPLTFCVKAGEAQCSISAGHQPNLVLFTQTAIEPGDAGYYGDELRGEVYYPSVYIEQEAQPEISFSEGWLGPYSKPIEVKVHDPGIGLSYVSVFGDGVEEEEPIYKHELCAGVQCTQEYTYDVAWSHWVDSEPLKVKAENATGVPVEVDHSFKVDTTPPQIKLTGLPTNGEVSASPHTVTVEAADEAEESRLTFASNSGVASFEASIDGGAATVLPGSCSAKCKVSAQYTIKGEGLSEGVHRLVVTAADNAGNAAAKEFTFDVRHVSPVAIGPGSVDPTTGQLTLNATDVSLGGVGGVSRTYQSRSLAAGAGGPLGPQWAISMGGGQGLTVLPSGGVVLTGPSGGTTTFARNEKGEYMSPRGDGDVRLEAKEANKEITEYVLTDTATGTATTFTQPSGTGKTAPAYVNQFGSEGALLNHPVSDAIDSSGNVWVTDYLNNRVEEFTSAGMLLAAYGSEGSAGGEFIDPWGVAINENTGNVYVTDQGNSRIEELSSSGAFISTFGWGVNDGKAQFETCTEAKRCRTGIAGAGSGQVSTEAGVAIDSSGNVWVADYGNNRIEKFTASGAFSTAIGFGVNNGEEKLQTCTSNSCRSGTSGSGQGQFKNPLNIAFSGVNVYVTDYGNNRVQELSTAGAYISQFGGSGSENRQFSGPYGIATDPTSGDLYVVDSGNRRVQQFTPEGGFIAKFGAVGTGGAQFAEPSGVAVNSAGGVYVVDSPASRVEEWAHPTWMPTIAAGVLPSGTTTYAYQAEEVEEGETVVEPIEALAPPPSGVSCGSKPEELTRGCRALTFNYAKTTTATAEAWGDYKGRLTRVYLHAWDPAAGKMIEPIVAQYSYDTQGRLRAEWDPRISPALKTTYGYDGEGHVTAMTPAGRQPWLFNYGTIEGDSAAGRLLSVARPAATTSTVLKERSAMPAPANTASPTLSSTSPEVGVTLTASSEGQWSNAPLTYGYQWERCEANTKPEGCTAIAGAVNQSYTPQAPEAGYVLRVQVTAENAAGAQTAFSAASNSVTGSNSQDNPAPPPPAVGTNSVTTLEYHVPASGTGAPYPMSEGEVARWGQKDDPVEAVAIFPPDEPMGWPAAHYKRATLHYWDAEGRVVNTALPTGAIATSEYNETNDIARTLSADNRATAITLGGGSAEKSAAEALLLDTESGYSPDGTELRETRGPQHMVKLATGSEVLARNHVQYHYDEGAPGGEPHLVTKTTDGAQYEGKEADVRTTTTSYSGVSWYPGQTGIGWRLRKPTSVTTDAGGLNLTSSTIYDPSTGNVLETITPGGAKSGEVPQYAAEFGKSGTGEGQLSSPAAVTLDSEGDIWVADSANNRIEEFSRSGRFIETFGFGVTINGKPKLEVCTSKCKAGIASTKKGALWKPEGIAYDPVNGALYVSDTSNDRVEEFTTEGRLITHFGKAGTGKGEFMTPQGLTVDSEGNIWVADGGNSRLERFTERGKKPATYAKPGEGEGEFSGVTDITFCAGKLYATDSGGQRVEEFSTSGAPMGQLGTESGRFTQISRIACDPTDNDLYVTDSGADRIDIFASSGGFVGAFGAAGSSAGQLNAPAGVTVAHSGAVYVVDRANNRVSEWQPPSAAHNSQTTYYSVAANASYPECGEHPEWANLPCQAQRAIEPPDATLPVSTFVYNVWDELERTTERFGSTTRIKAQTYDPAGRGESSETTSTVDRPLPKVVDAYNSESGVLETQSAVGEPTKTITSKYNTLGQLERYTDADENNTTYTYEVGGDARLEEVNDGKGTQTYAYDPTTGAMTSLLDSAAGTFAAGYDVEGSMTSERYPDGLTATYTINPVGQATGLVYTKASNCGASCTWFSDSITPSIHGETLAQTSTLAKAVYAYDQAGRLTETQEVPAGKGCTTRIYRYDNESNRTSLTTVEGSEGKCANTEGSTESHSYDTVNRLSDSGVTYETFGNTYTLPAPDAGKYRVISSYFVDGQLATQTQNKERSKYSYDPGGRTREIISEGSTEATIISHYPGPGEAVSWSSEGKEAWTRSIPGIDGTLSATQSSAGAIVLQLPDLQGNVVATAGSSETETSLLSTYNSTEFGVPNDGSKPPKYAWLGASGLSTELASGLANEGGASYVPQIARSLQTEPVIPPIPADNGSAAAYTAQISAWSVARLDAESAAAIAEYAAKQAAARTKAEEEAARGAQSPGESPSPGEGGAEGGEGDPCTTTYRQTWGEDKSQVMEAWATIEWCYGGGRVLSAHLKPNSRGARAHGGSWAGGYHAHFFKWNNRAEWRNDGVYSIQRIAVFESTVPWEVELISPVPHPVYFYFVDVEFLLYPGGTAETNGWFWEE